MSAIRQETGLTDKRLPAARIYERYALTLVFTLWVVVVGSGGGGEEERCERYFLCFDAVFAEPDELEKGR